MNPTIPAQQIVSVVPSVIGSGGSALVLQGLLLTTNSRVPIGQVLSFPTAAAVASYFGALSAEAAAANAYFLGFAGSSIKPGTILFAQYNQVAVPAYARGASVSTMTLATLQSLSGTLSLTVDGYARVSAAINLASAASFSAAAGLIQTALDTTEPTEATGTGTINPNAVTGSIAGNVLTVSAVTTGCLAAGQLLTGANGLTAANLSILNQLTGTAGGIGTYTLTGSMNLASQAITASGGGLTITVASTGTFAIGQVVTGAGVTAGTMITAFGTGIGGVGTYAVSISQTIGSIALTMVTAPVVVTYDSTSGGFIITSGVTGAASSITACSVNAIATALGLTTAAGVTLSQGAAPAVPASYMNSIIAITTNWASFMTIFDPDALAASGNTVKQAFAAWNNAQANLYMYVVWDTDITPTQSNNASTSLGQVLKANGNSGTALIYAPDYTIAAFVLGSVASINFTTRNGRITMAFKGQSGIAANVTNAAVASNLIANGYNFYGNYSTANQNFIMFYPGQLTGPFAWIDAYVDQIWLNSAFQLSLFTLLTQVLAVPYATPGYALLRAACMVPINQGLTFGAFQPGVPLSALQAAQVNNQAGQVIDGILSTQGWYLQILPATAQVRGARQSPPMTFWYMDGGAVQQINLASVEVQ